jgi:polyhydroxybutyrate depolymerase
VEPAPVSSKRFLVVISILVAVPAAFAVVKTFAFHLRNRNNGSIITSGVTREFLLYVPRTYQAAKPAPLVISFHGAGGWPAQQMETSGWNELADREGFIVVYPAGLENVGPRIWHVDRGEQLTRDVRFVSDLIEHLASSYNIDRRRIYANGLSNGGGMSFALSCMLAGRIAAVGLVAAAQTLPASWCTEPRPVPMIAFHGTADPIVPFNGGVSPVSPRPFPNVPIFVSRWARRNGCTPEPVPSQLRGGIDRSEYVGCTGEASVVVYSIRGGGHSWPGGKPLPVWFVGPTSRSIDATREMWRFFRAHPARNPAPPSSRAALRARGNRRQVHIRERAAAEEDVRGQRAKRRRS